jgi:hypothetical protein
MNCEALAGNMCGRVARSRAKLKPGLKPKSRGGVSGCLGIGRVLAIFLPIIISKPSVGVGDIFLDFLAFAKRSCLLPLLAL